MRAAVCLTCSDNWLPDRMSRISDRWRWWWLCGNDHLQVGGPQRALVGFGQTQFHFFGQVEFFDTVLQHFERQTGIRAGPPGTYRR